MRRPGDEKKLSFAAGNVLLLLGRFSLGGSADLTQLFTAAALTRFLADGLTVTLGTAGAHVLACQGHGCLFAVLLEESLTFFDLVNLPVFLAVIDNW